MRRKMMENKNLKTYNEDGSVNEEVIRFCHENFMIQNLKNDLMREFIPISNWTKLSNRVDDIFENYFKNEVYPRLDNYKDVISLSTICNMCVVCIIDNINIIRMGIYGYCIDQMYNEKESNDDEKHDGEK